MVVKVSDDLTSSSHIPEVNVAGKSNRTLTFLRRNSKEGTIEVHHNGQTSA